MKKDVKEKLIYSVLQPDESKAVEFAAAGKYPEAKGTLFKKRIINLGEYVDQWMPEFTFTLDKEWAENVLQNFADKTVGRVFVPASHTDDPDKNRGEVIDMFMSDDGAGIDAILDIRDPETVQKINDDLIWDNSIGFTMDWISKTGEEKGAAIYHVALVNNPYIEDMTPFEVFSKITEDERAVLAKGHGCNAIMLSRSGLSKELKEKNQMGKITIKNEKEFEVTVPVMVDGKETQEVIPAGGEIEVDEEQKDAIIAEIAAAEAPKTEEEEEEEEKKTETEEEGSDEEDASKTEEEKAKEAQEAELSKLKDQVAEFRKVQTEAQYSKLLEEGKIVPAQERAFKALSSIGQTTAQFSTKSGKVVEKSVSKLLETFFKSAPKLVNFSEQGSGKKTEGEEDVVENQTAYDKLSEEDKAGLKAANVSKDRYNESVEHSPQVHGQTEEEEK